MGEPDSLSPPAGLTTSGYPNVLYNSVNSAEFARVAG